MKKLVMYALCILMVIVMTNCTGPAGPSGAQGIAGPAGTSTTKIVPIDCADGTTLETITSDTRNSNTTSITSINVYKTVTKNLYSELYINDTLYEEKWWNSNCEVIKMVYSSGFAGKTLDDTTYSSYNY